MPLENGTHYYIRMIAIGALPDYLKSSSANYSGTATPATTPAELPSGSAAPKNGSVDLAWTAPTDNGGSAVTGYIGQYSTDTLVWSDGFDVGASTLAASIKGLTNGTLYYFRIAAKNIMGTSSQWSPFSATPIGKESQTNSFDLTNLPSKSFGDSPFDISSYAHASSSAPETFSSSTTGICTLTGSIVTLLSAGTCTLSAIQSGTSLYDPSPSVQQSFQVGKANQSISFDLSSLSVQVNDSPLNIGSHATSTSGLSISLTSSTIGICTISGSILTAVSAGNCTIVASQSGNTNYNAASSVTQTFSIGKLAQTITFPTLTNKSFGAVAFDIPVHPSSSSSLAISYTSTTTSVCTNEGSVITIVGVGTCTISASQAGNSNYNAAAPVTQSFTVTKGSQTIVFPSITDRTLASSSYLATVSVTSGLTVSLAATTASICSVSNLTITFVTVGTCTVVATQTGNSQYEAAQSVTRSFEINGKIDSVLTNFSDENRTYGEPAFTIIAPTANVAGTFTYTTSNTFMLPISGNTATIGYVGTATITATFTPASSSYNGSSITKTVTIARANQSPLAISAASGSLQSGLMLSTTGGTGFGNVSYALVSSPSCTLLSYGYLTRSTPGDCFVVATKESDGVHFAIDSAQATITFSKLPQTISFTLAS
jgi:hypothetical protein